ncbi:MAG TPA: phosphoribosylformylglycinamidine cyclo-ligase [bacterium (Candidatus Stahlbacteria)]|nr:phosphoribosylformylglycinamidine cyclo-ligase [Candidatus Stahlbacteria bacterium]
MKYKDAGVDISSLNKVKKRIAQMARATFNDNVLTGIGLFGGLYRFGDKILVSSTDSVGTKLKIATLAGNHRSVGVDIVNHCINDILTLGAMPLFFLDYIAFSELDPGILLQIFEGLSRACQTAGVALIGGETAQLPGYFQANDYDLVGFITGVVGDGELLTGSGISPGDILIGLPSSGLHTNGFSLVRRIFLKEKGCDLSDRFPELNKNLGEELLTPHRLYLNEVSRVRSLVKGIVHVTGGGFIDNIPRVLPEGLGADVYLDRWEVPPIFRLIKELGSVPEEEMYRTFNMGIGMILVVGEDLMSKVLELSGGFKIGMVVDRPGVQLQ